MTLNLAIYILRPFHSFSSYLSVSIIVIKMNQEKNTNIRTAAFWIGTS